MHLFGLDFYFMYKFANVLQNFILDCCTSKIYGTPNFKGKYKFAKALAGERRIQNCIYNSSSKSSRTAFVKCIPDLEVGPSYSSLNLTSCQAKYKITGELGKLEQVRITTLSLVLKDAVMQARYIK